MSQSPPSRGAWIEMADCQKLTVSVSSPPSRGAWIEIVLRVASMEWIKVAPLAGGVD